MSEAMDEAISTDEAHEEHHPKGTWMVMGFLLLVIVGLWISVYYLLLTRG